MEMVNDFKILFIIEKSKLALFGGFCVRSISEFKNSCNLGQRNFVPFDLFTWKKFLEIYFRLKCSLI